MSVKTPWAVVTSSVSTKSSKPEERAVSRDERVSFASASNSLSVNVAASGGDVGGEGEVAEEAKWECADDGVGGFDGVFADCNRDGDAGDDDVVDGGGSGAHDVDAWRWRSCALLRSQKSWQRKEVVGVMIL